MATATKSKDKTTETTHRCDAKKIAIGSVWSRHSYGTVVARTGNRFTLRDESGFEWDIDGANILENQFSFADQFEQEISSSRTEINQVIMENRGIAMTICFKKKAKHTDVAKALAEGQGDMSDRAWSKHVKDLIEGEERVMIGHHSGVVDEHQRLKFIESGKGPRLVDTRTTQWVIVDRTKYVVKSK
jgi:predicted peptidase